MADGDDLYQEFCFELTRRPCQLLGGFKAGSAPLDCWIFAVAFRICRNKLCLRKYRRLERSVQIDNVDPEMFATPCCDISPEELHVAPVLIRRLGKRDRFLIRARFGLTPFETPWRMVDIAKHLQWSVPATYAHLERALDELRAHMKLHQNS